MRLFKMAIILVLVATSAGGDEEAGAEGWKAGTARVAITPDGPVWMAGYAARTGPSEGALHDLWAKALVLEDDAGTTAVLVTLDLCGIGRDLSGRVRDRIEERHGLDRDRVVLACSHTHSGPVVGRNLIGMYPMDDDQKARVVRYTDRLADLIVQVVGQALAGREEVHLTWGQGRCDFAVNRRENDQAKVDALRDQIALKGPVDHDVPVLVVSARDGGARRAIVFGYACHCTTLPIQQLSGDYAGFAQIDLERSNPGAQAMFVAGCGGDQNPLPRGTVAHAQRYGAALATAVGRAMNGPMEPIAGPLRTSAEEIDLPFGPIPGREVWERDARSDHLADANRARTMLARLDAGEAILTAYPYPVQVWRLGADPGPVWVFLGGEVTVDYALRLKRNLGTSRTWVSAYCNDVMAYIPSLRVLREGGYEGGGAMVYYGLPASWSEEVEERIIEAIRRNLAATRPGG